MPHIRVDADIGEHGFLPELKAPDTETQAAIAESRMMMSKRKGRLADAAALQDDHEKIQLPVNARIVKIKPHEPQDPSSSDVGIAEGAIQVLLGIDRASSKLSSRFSLLTGLRDRAGHRVSERPGTTDLKCLVQESDVLPKGKLERIGTDGPCCTKARNMPAIRDGDGHKPEVTQLRHRERVRKSSQVRCATGLPLHGSASEHFGVSLEGDAGQGVNGLCGNFGLHDQYRDPFSGLQIAGMGRKSADMDHQARALGFNGEWDH